MWDEDREFGRQVVAGTHPCALVAVTDYPSWAAKKSHITDAQLKGLLGGQTLQVR